MKDNEYKCAKCGHVYEYCWSEEEAIAEKDAIFGSDVPLDECVVICDDCFNDVIYEV